MYHDIGAAILILAAICWPFIQAWIWWPTIRSYSAGDDEIDCRYDDETPLIAFVGFGIFYAIGAVFSSIAWPITIPLALAFGAIHLIRVHNKLKKCETKTEDKSND